MRTFLALLALLAFTGPLYGQDCGPSWLSGTGAASPYWIEVDGVERSSHTNIATALRALADSVRRAPAADVRVLADFRGEWRGPCADASGDTVFVTDTLTVTDTVEVQLPPDTVTVELPPDTVFVSDTVEVCPAGWTCTPPDTIPEEPEEPADTTAAPGATNVSLMGYAAPDMQNPREHGLRVTWDANPEVDYWEVYGGRDDGATPPWGPVEVTENVYSHPLPADAEEGRHFTCVVGRIDGRPAAEQQCNGFDWAPIMRGHLAVTLLEGELPLTTGDSVNFELHRVDRGWADGSASRPDSVVFTVGDDHRMDNIHPYTYPSSTSGAIWTVPAGDSVIVNWTVHPSTAGSMGGSVAYPVQ